MLRLYELYYRKIGYLVITKFQQLYRLANCKYPYAYANEELNSTNTDKRKNMAAHKMFTGNVLL